MFSHKYAYHEMYREEILKIFTLEFNLLHVGKTQVISWNSYTSI